MWFPKVDACARLRTHESAVYIVRRSLQEMSKLLLRLTSKNLFEALRVSTPCSKRVRGWRKGDFCNFFFICSTSSFAAFACVSVMPSSLAAK
ncbi:hypothetical protein V6Z93_010415 [Aspergillus fumigatus]